MAKLKIATFNIEWMISIFGGEWTNWDGKIPNSFPGKSLGGIKLAPIDDVPGLCERIAGVIREVGADILGIQEGPPRKDQMELFVKKFLNEEYVVHQSNAKSQSIFALVRASIADKVVAFDPKSDELSLLSSKAPYYPWGAFKAADRKDHKFDRIPLVLRFTPAFGQELQVIVVHTKSKFSKLKTKKQWEDRDPVAVLDALNARQKLSAEIFRLREFLDRQFGSPNSHPSIVVMGDFNDGPFGELMEKEFLIHNILDELVGSFLRPERLFSHAMAPDVLASATTVRFSDPLEEGELVDELIDHLLVSPAMRDGAGIFALDEGSCKVEALAYDHFNDPSDEKDRGLRPSDHKPVSAELLY